MNEKIRKILKISAIAVTLLYIFGILIALILTNAADNHWKKVVIDGWFWFGALVFYIVCFPVFASLVSVFSLIRTRLKYGAGPARRIIHTVAYVLAAVNTATIIFILTVLHSFDYYTYIPVVLSVPVLLTAAIDGIYCRARAKRQARTTHEKI